MDKGQTIKMIMRAHGIDYYSVLGGNLVFIVPYAPFIYPVDCFSIDGYYAVSNSAYHDSKSMIAEFKEHGIMARKFSGSLRRLAKEAGLVGILKSGFAYCDAYGTYLFICAFTFNHCDMQNDVGHTSNDEHEKKINEKIVESRAAERNCGEKTTNRSAVESVCSEKNSATDFGYGTHSGGEYPGDKVKAFDEKNSESKVEAGSCVQNDGVSVLPKISRQCISCGACVRSCPTGAISFDGLDAEICLRRIQEDAQKGLSNRQACFADRLGGRLLGCSECQKACPINSAVTPVRAPEGLCKVLHKENIRSLFDGGGIEFLTPLIGGNLAKPSKLQPITALLTKNAAD